MTRFASAVLLSLLLVAVPSRADQPKVIVIEMDMNRDGGYGFYPENVAARPGDVLRFVNRDGLEHNVRFPRKENPEGRRLPPESPMLISEGEVYELKVELEPGTYRFQCDPHLSMGMIGKLTVTE